MPQVLCKGGTSRRTGTVPRGVSVPVGGSSLYKATQPGSRCAHASALGLAQGSTPGTKPRDAPCIDSSAPHEPIAKVALRVLRVLKSSIPR